MQKNKKAFTLIELLVVVLIIAILTAVALPKYQTAVHKSRYVALMPLARSVKEAEETMWLENDRYSKQLDELPIGLPGTVNNNKVTNNDGTELEVNIDDSHNYVRATKNGLNNNYVMYLARSSNFPGEVHCEALKGDKVAQQVCLSYGPKNETEPITGTDANYDAYILEGTGNGTGSAKTVSSRTWTHVANWDCNGTDCDGYDEDRNRVVRAYECSYTYDCYDEEGHKTCDFPYHSCTKLDLLDEKGEAISYRECRGGWKADGSCNGYMEQIDIVDRAGFLTYLSCETVNAEGNCTHYSSASVWFYEDAGDYQNEEGEEWFITTEAKCSEFDATNGCTAFSRLYESDTCTGETYRECLEISGTTCLNWSEVLSHC